MTITARRCTRCRLHVIAPHPATGKGEWCEHCDAPCTDRRCTTCKGRAA